MAAHMRDRVVVVPYERRPMSGDCPINGIKPLRQATLAVTDPTQHAVLERCASGNSVKTRYTYPVGCHRGTGKGGACMCGTNRR